MTGSRGHSADVGRSIRDEFIPTGMSVTEAARRLGVSRPTLSKLLNGKVVLSHDMAVRLERTFGADRTRLNELQGASDRDRLRSRGRAVAVDPYVPSFLTIKARQIAAWGAENIDARALLPVLVRRLVHSTGRELRHVDIPGYDSAQRPGWDGWIEADAATPWVPEGRSGWEFSVDRRPSQKAERDYQVRLRMLSSADRAQCTFVFVTPRIWTTRDQWVRKKEAAGDWKAVKVFDASNLEQWLETTITPQIWLAKELEIRTGGFWTVDHFWDRWATASDPPMTPEIFASAIAAHSAEFTKWLEMPNERPLTVAADSKQEAIAFVACMLRHKEVAPRYRDQAVVFESAESLRDLAQSSSPLIPIVFSNDTEREIVTLYRHRPCVVVRPRNAVDRDPDIAIELLGHSAFEKGLADMGIERERFDRLAHESGRSPTVLRRRLSRIEALRTPPWAGSKDVARCLVPITLIGAWHRGSAADREILAALGDTDYTKVEESIADLLQRDDCPVWCVDQYRGVVSKIDALFAISPWMTEKDISDFMRVAECVLSESDPSLDLPDDQQWAAAVYGKVREHSSALRTGVCETLVMLSVHGNFLFRRRLGIDIEACVTSLVERLLTPLTGETLRSHDRDLPSYAEAAPNAFLALIDEDLTGPQPSVLELLKPVSAGAFESPWRTGLLWSLERLAWNPRNLVRVVAILARLSETKIDDNWVNKPINSLSAIFRSWIPQTAASLDDRVKAFTTLCRSFPDIGWRLCVQQVKGGPDFGHYSGRPHWRNDAAGAGQPVARSEHSAFVRRALDLAISWSPHTETTLGDLVEHVGDLPQDDQRAVWRLVDAWSETDIDDIVKAKLRDRVRRAHLTWRGRLRETETEQRNRAREVYEALGSRDPVVRNAWLFASPWVEGIADDSDDENLDPGEEERRVDQCRREAMTEIWSSRGLDGALQLLPTCDPGTVGSYVAGCAVTPHAALDVIQACLSSTLDQDETANSFLRGFFWRLDENTRSTLITTIAEIGTVEQVVRLFRCFPFRGTTWRLLNQNDRPVRERYWSTAYPVRGRFTEAETAELIDRLLDAGRPFDAFFAVQFNWDEVETSRLRRLLLAMVTTKVDPTAHFKIDSYQIGKALKSLADRPGIPIDIMAQLEFAFIDVLGDREHGIPNLEKVVTESPIFFVRVLALYLKRSDDGNDPPEWRTADPDRALSSASAAYRLLSKISRIPGTNRKGTVDAHALKEWVKEARRLCREYGRGSIGDQKIGELLSNAPAEKDGVWPCRPVCEVLDANPSEDMATGVRVGVYNARGAHSRGLDEGGQQERELSARYRMWAKRLVFAYPRVAGILEDIAQAYDRDAERHDSDVQVRKRLEH